MNATHPTDWYGWEPVGKRGLAPFLDIAASPDDSGAVNVFAVDSQKEVSHARQTRAGEREWTEYVHPGLGLAGFGLIAAGFGASGNVALGAVSAEGIAWTKPGSVCRGPHVERMAAERPRAGIRCAGIRVLRRRGPVAVWADTSRFGGRYDLDDHPGGARFDGMERDDHADPERRCRHVGRPRSAPAGRLIRRVLDLRAGAGCETGPQPAVRARCHGYRGLAGKQSCEKETRSWRTGSNCRGRRLLA